MTKAKRLLTDVRVWILIVFVALSILAISPHLSRDGVAVRQVMKDSAAAQAGLQGPEPTAKPTSRERILEVNGVAVNSPEEFYEQVSSYPANRTITLQSTKGLYTVRTRAHQIFDARKNVSVANGTEPIGITVTPAPLTNLKLGLDLSGGTRVVLKPAERVSQDDLQLIIENIKQRLNVFGLSDIVVRDAKDLNGDEFIIVEIAGANRDEVQALLANQGKFEAKIGNDTVFRGGQDITYVCRSAECSGIDRQVGCGPSGDGIACRFSFQIQLSPDAAARQADLTRNLSVVGDAGGSYLEQPLDLYLDDELVDTLQISSDLRGRDVTTILITGSGAGTSQQAAAENAISNMKTLQTVLITGSLPVRLEIVKSDSISPAIGGEFVKNALLLGVLSIIAVAIVLVVRYRQLIISIPIMITMLSEIIIVLGFAAVVGWNLDLAGIAAIVIAIGSGVDDQIVMIDETLRGGGSKAHRSWKDKIASAFIIIFASYFTLASAMVPLFFAGAGLLRGFAITTLVGITAGVLITRPAFAEFMELLLKKEED